MNNCFECIFSNADNYYCPSLGLCIYSSTDKSNEQCHEDGQVIENWANEISNCPELNSKCAIGLALDGETRENSWIFVTREDINRQATPEPAESEAAEAEVPAEGTETPEEASEQNSEQTEDKLSKSYEVAPSEVCEILIANSIDL